MSSEKRLNNIPAGSPVYRIWRTKEEEDLISAVYRTNSQNGRKNWKKRGEGANGSVRLALFVVHARPGADYTSRARDTADLDPLGTIQEVKGYQ